MAIEKVCKVVTYSWEEGAKGPYMKAALNPGHDDQERNYALFDGEQHSAIEQAHQNDLSLLAKFDKKGNYWNVISLEVMEAGTASPETQREQSEKGTKDLRDKKGDPTRRIDPQERGMWEKEIGLWLRDNPEGFKALFPKTHKALQMQYQNSMLNGVDVEIVSE